jgi:hypothetical protein
MPDTLFYALLVFLSVTLTGEVIDAFVPPGKERIRKTIKKINCITLLGYSVTVSVFIVITIWRER